MYKKMKPLTLGFSALTLMIVVGLFFLLPRIPRPNEMAVGSAVEQAEPARPTPPIDSPLATPTPTASPTPIPYYTPTPAPTLPSVDEIEPGLKFVYTETDVTGAKTIIWMANVNDLSKPKRLTAIEHRVGYWARGSVSPDGKWIAIEVNPPNYGQRTLRMYGGELWIMNADGTDLRQLPGNVRSIIDWSPQGEITIESGVDIDNPTMPEDSVRPEYYAITPDGEVTKIMGAMLENVAVDPVGWSADGTEFYYTWRDMGPGDLALGTWELRAIKRSDGTVRTMMKAPYKAAEAPLLMANRTRIIYIAYTETAQLQIVSDVTGGNSTILAEVPRSQDSQEWLWSIASPSNALILQRGLPKSTERADLLQIDLTTDAIEPLPVSEVDKSFTPVSWSPNEEWVILRKTPLDYTSTAVLHLQSGNVFEIRRAHPRHPIAVFGWISE